MDTLTHALSGALLARALAPRRPAPEEPGPRARMAAGFVAAAFPDVDFALRLAGTLVYLDWHQGPTHSLVLLPAWALALAHLFARASRGRPGWRAYLAPAALGLAAHIAGDAITAYGTMLLWPLSRERFAAALAYVLDPYFTAILLAGLAAALVRPGRRAPALAALAVLAAYLGLQAALQARALEAGRVYAQARGLSGATVHALPQPLSPFHWKILVEAGEAYHEAFVHLRRRHEPAPAAPGAGLFRRIAAGYRPVSAETWSRRSRFGESALEQRLAREAWAAHGFERFRRFARFPALESVESHGARTCAWFVDLRFTLPALPPSFRFGMCREGAGAAWRLERARGAFWID